MSPNAFQHCPKARVRLPEEPLSPPPATAPARCRFVFADGRACRMLRSSAHGSFCVPHARDEQTLLAAAQAGEQLLSLGGDFKTAPEINRALGRLFSLRAENKISRRDAGLFAYLGQLILQTLPAVRQERNAARGPFSWQDTVGPVVVEYAPSSTCDDSNDEAGDDGSEGGESG